MSDLLERSTSSLAADLKSGAMSSVALTMACLDRIANLEPDIQAWAHLDRDMALRQAQAADARRASGKPLGALHGLPVAVKDIIDTADLPTEYNSPIYRGRRPTKDATLVQRLRSTGAIVMGKTVTSEFAVYTAGPTRNPHDLSRTPGGSSSGSAAAIAARMVPLALATQTNGSTIRPASFCGVAGFKPSLGVLPRTGILKQSTMLDQPGLMAMDVAGVALLADALGGYDPLDEQSLRPPMPLLSAATVEAEAPPRLAFIRSSYWDQADETTREAIEGYVASLGGMVETVALPVLFDDAASIQGVIMNAGIADACRDDYVRSRDRMSAVLLGIVENGRKISAMEFIAALAQRDRLRALYAEIVSGYDAVVTPAALGIAPKREAGTGNPIMATLWTLLGVPAITLPLLTGAENMPVGVQFVGRLNDDVGLIRAAAWLERHHACKPR